MTITHRKSNTVEYNIWIGIKTRCYNSKSHIFKYYGERGIVMCDHWKMSFENFYADMGPRPSPQHSIERVDNSGPYSPKNCHWATDVEQANNTSANRLITYNGVTQSLANWARQLDIPYNRLRARILRGLPIEQAFASKDITGNKIVHRITYNGETLPISKWAQRTNIRSSTLYDRIIVQSWPIERAFNTADATSYPGRLLTFNGKTKNLSEWAKQLNISVAALSKRLRKGWPIEQSLTTPAHTEKITHR